MKVLNNIPLTEEEKEFIIALIIVFGNNEYSVNEKNIGRFNIEYIKKLFNSNEYLRLKPNLKNNALKISKSIEEKLGEYLA